MKSKAVKLVVFVPETHADLIREAMGQAGAGAVGHYKYCTFSVKGIGRYMPQKGAHPKIGKVGNLEKVKEERIETVFFKKDLAKIIKAIKKVHPYEKTEFNIYPLVLDSYGK
jgi:hypothetical protein